MNSSENNWYILKDEQKYGPYDYTVMIQLIQNHQLMDYHYVWAPHLNAWTQVHKLTEFSKEKFMLILQSKDSSSAAFTPRKNERIETDITLLGHNYVRFFDGQLKSISIEGGLCLLNSPLIQIGDKLKLHLKSHAPETIPFNVEAEVIRKNFSQQRLNSKSGLFYAVRFYDIQKQGREQINQWISTTSKVG